MSENKENSNNLDEEIDLRVVIRYINSLINSLIRGLIQIVRFFYKYKIQVILLIVLGGVLGYFADNYAKLKYKSNFVVSSNFESADYLYNKVELFENKIKQKDTVFLKEIFGENYKLVKGIEIEPVIDIYDFINSNEINVELFELLSDNEDLKEFVTNPVNSMNYEFHKINLYIMGKMNHEALSDSFFEYLNSNVYFERLKTITLESNKKLLRENDSSLSQINELINSISKSGIGDNMVISVTEKPVLDDLLERKRRLINEEKDLRNNIQNKTEIITTVDANYSLDYERELFEKSKKILIPLFFVILFSSYFLIKLLVKKGKQFVENQD